MWKNVLPAVAVFLIACHGTGLPVGDLGATDSSSHDLTGVTNQTFSLSFGPVTVTPGMERTQCITKRLGNEGAVHIGEIRNHLGPASHHMIVYRVNDTVESLTPTDCQPFTDTLNPAKGSPLIITQKADDVLTLPDGVAYALDANQMLRIEIHYVNATQAPVMLTAQTNLVQLSDEKFKFAAGFIFIGDPDIRFAPGAKFTLGPVYLQLQPEFADVNFFAVTGHAHQLGTNVTVSTATPDKKPAQSVYDVENWLWSESPTVYASTPFKVPANGGFSFSCSWNNTTTKTVRFGESTNNEMCFFWAYYYPDKGARVCFHTDQAQGGLDLCCPGSSLCSSFGM